MKFDLDVDIALASALISLVHVTCGYRWSWNLLPRRVDALIAWTRSLRCPICTYLRVKRFDINNRTLESASDALHL